MNCPSALVFVPYLVYNVKSFSLIFKVGKSTETTYADKEIVEDTQYMYRVLAENKVGPGPPSEPTQPVTAKDPWSE